jgi:hypothetical protein
LGVWGRGHGPQPPIPNPQSPIPNPHYIDNSIILYNEKYLKLKLNIYNFR